MGFFTVLCSFMYDSIAHAQHMIALHMLSTYSIVHILSIAHAQHMISDEDGNFVLHMLRM